MKKRILASLLAVMLLGTLLASCESPAATPNEDAAMKVGMVTDSGTIDDKSFNQGTWEGILKAKTDLNVEEKYIKPNGETTSDYTQEITNLYDSGYKFIITPGYKFEVAIFEMQERYSDAKFVILDGAPNNGKDFGDPERQDIVGGNTVAILFAEDQSGFLAGVAAALELKEGKLGFIGGMAVPAVQRFNWGFQQGVLYANANYGTNCTMDENHILYQGTFHEVAAGQQLAASMYDAGVKAVFAAAGGVGVGVINEATQRRQADEDV